MARRKTTEKHGGKHDPIHDVYVLQEDDEEDEDRTIIETQAMMDWIEYDTDEDEEENRGQPRRTCRVTFHVDLPEHIAQHLFADYVKDARMTVEFQPVSKDLRRRDPLLRS